MRSIARSVICSIVGWYCTGGGGVVKNSPPKNLDQNEVFGGCNELLLALEGLVGDAFFERMLLRKPK